MTNCNWLKHAQYPNDLKKFFKRHPAPWTLETRPYKDETQKTYEEKYTERDVLVNGNGEGMFMPLEVLPICTVVNEYHKIFTAETLMVDKTKLEEIWHTLLTISYEPKLMHKDKMLELAEKAERLTEALLQDKNNGSAPS